MELSTLVQNAVTSVVTGLNSAREALKEGNYTVDGEYGDRGINIHISLDPASLDSTIAPGCKLEFDVYVERKPEPTPPKPKKKYKRVPVEDDEDEDE
jgi:hypothetical protein